jgi:hypothetical protein
MKNEVGEMKFTLDAISFLNLVFSGFVWRGMQAPRRTRRSRSLRELIFETFVSFVIFVVNGINLAVPGYPLSRKTP